jgi:hypothetical protein
LSEVRYGRTERAEAEVVERVQQPARVLRVDPDPQVEVLREPGMTVGRNRITADDEERTSRATQYPMNSLKSRSSSIGPPVVLRSQGLDLGEPFGHRPGQPVGGVVLRVAEAAPRDDTGDHGTSPAAQGRRRHRQ